MAFLPNVTVVAPDQSVSISGLITRYEFEAFGGRHLDVTAEVSINAPTDGSSNFRPRHCDPTDHRCRCGAGSGSCAPVT